MEFIKQNLPITSSHMRKSFLQGRSEALSDLFNVCDKVLGVGSAVSAKAQLE